MCKALACFCSDLSGFSCVYMDSERTTLGTKRMFQHPAVNPSPLAWVGVRLRGPWLCTQHRRVVAAASGAKGLALHYSFPSLQNQSHFFQETRYLYFVDEMEV